MAMTDAERARRYRAKKRDANRDAGASRDAKRDASRDEKRHETASRNVTKSVTKRHVTRHGEMQKNQARGGKKRHEKRHETSRDAPVYIYTNTESEETPSMESFSSEDPALQTLSSGSSGATVTAAPMDFRKYLWAGLPKWLADRTGFNDAAARKLLGRWFKTHGIGETVAAVVACEKEQPIDPVSWIVARLQTVSASDGVPARRYDQRRSYGQTNPDERQTASVDHFAQWSEKMRGTMASLLEMGKPGRMTFQDMAALVQHGYASAEDAKQCGCPESMLCNGKS